MLVGFGMDIAVAEREQANRTLQDDPRENNFNCDSALRCAFRIGRSGSR
jgi:hypothetical protein